MKKKIIFIMLAVLMISTMLVGCSKKNELVGSKWETIVYGMKVAIYIKSSSELEMIVPTDPVNEGIYKLSDDKKSYTVWDKKKSEKEMGSFVIDGNTLTWIDKDGSKAVFTRIKE